MSPDRLAAAGREVVAVALAEWRRVVRDPSPRIDEYIRGEKGLAWPTADATFRRPDAPYERDGQFEWCGAFAAHCWGVAGVSRPLRYRHFASCNRLSRSPLDRVPLAELRPGDVLVVGEPGGRPWGSHVTIVERVDGGLAHTIEGNARGLLGDGSIGEGVVRRTRPVVPTAAGRCPATGLPSRAVVRFAYRPTLDDLGGPR